MLSMPDITPAQIVAIVGSILGVVVSAGVPMSKDLEESIIRLVTVLAPVVIGADAAIRFGRSKIAAAKVNQGEKL